MPKRIPPAKTVLASREWIHFPGSVVGYPAMTAITDCKDARPRCSPFLRRSSCGNTDHKVVGIGRTGGPDVGIHEDLATRGLVPVHVVLGVLLVLARKPTGASPGLQRPVEVLGTDESPCLPTPFSRPGYPETDELIGEPAATPEPRIMTVGTATTIAGPARFIHFSSPLLLERSSNGIDHPRRRHLAGQQVARPRTRTSRPTRRPLRRPVPDG